VRHPLWWALLLVGGFLVGLPLLVESIQGRRLSILLLVAGALVAIVAGLNGLWLPERERYARRALRLGLVFLVGLPLAAFGFERATGGAVHEKPAAIAAAVAAAPLAQYAVDHRPILLFDSGERFRTPLDVEAMLSTATCSCARRATGCWHTAPRSARHLSCATMSATCASTPSRSPMPAADDDLRARRARRGSSRVDGHRLLVVPAGQPGGHGAGRDVRRGARHPGDHVLRHQSDWGRDRRRLRCRAADAVHYAAHSDVIDVPWPALQAAMKTRELAPFAKRLDVANHPLVFVARGTHAAYPTPCFTDNCPATPCSKTTRTTADTPGRRTRAPTPDASPPSGRGERRSRLVERLRRLLGSAICIAGGIYCARSHAPKAPGNQGRYQHPWCFQLCRHSRRPPAGPADARDLPNTLTLASPCGLDNEARSQPPPTCRALQVRRAATAEYPARTEAGLCR